MKRTLLNLASALFVSAVLGGGILGLQASENQSFSAELQSQIQVNGKVVDASGQPLVGVTVVQAGNEANGSMTDLEGGFTLTVPQGSELIVSYIGYKTVTVAASQGAMTITLEEDTVGIDDVVVVGFGVQKKANLTGSATQVNMEEVLGNRPVSNAAMALQGAIPGLMVNGTSGSPGASKSFNIRGTLSINGGGPLVLIDNVEGDINLLNPEDIESVTVLKDAASAAVYGARAAGGVILVTTKQPKSNEKFTLNYNFNLGWNQSINAAKQASLDDYIQGYLDAGYTSTYWAGNGDVSRWKELREQYKSNPSSLDAPYGVYKEGASYYFLGETDLFKDAQEVGFTQNHNLSASGGTDRIRFRIAGGYNKEDGPMITNKDSYVRKNLTTFVSGDITKWFTQEAQMTYTEDERHQPTEYGFTTRLINWYPDKIPGDYIGADYDVPTKTNANYMRLAPMSTAKTSTPRITARTILKPLKGWTITGEYTYDQKNYTWHHYDTPYEMSEAQMTYRTYPNPGQDVYRWNDEQEKYTAFNIFSNYAHTWGKHDFKAMAGFNQEYYYYRYHGSWILDQTVSSVPSFGGGTGEKTLQESYSEYAIRGAFARLNYAYDNRYLLEVNGRYDGSSKFPKATRFGFFPSVSAGWRIAQEKWMDWSDNWLDDLKLRVSYGSIGNQAINPYVYTPQMGIGESNAWLHNSKYVTIINMPGMVSGAFTWETVTTLNIGVDLGLFSNRLQGTFDWYNRKTKGMLSAGVQLPGVVGATAPTQNIADMKSKGWELSLTWRDRVGKDFNYYVGFNIYDHRSFIDKYNNESGLISDYYVGQELNQIWGYVSDGYYTIDDFDLDAAKNGVWTLKEGITRINGYNVQPGDEKFKDLDGDNVITAGAGTVEDPGDRKIIGNSTQRYQFGANLGLSWKGLALDIRLQGVGKRDYWIGGAAIFPFAGSGASDAVFQALYYNQTDYWRAKSYDPADPDYMVAENPNAKLFRIYDLGNNVGSNTRTSDKYLQNAAYLRIKNITVSYSFPQEWLQKIRMKEAKLYVSVENLATFTSLPKGYDPERLSWGYPFSRIISLGASISF